MKTSPDVTSSIRRAVAASEKKNLVQQLGEALGVSKAASRQAKQQMFIRYLKNLEKTFHDLSKIASVLGVDESTFLLTEEDLGILKAHHDSAESLARIEDQLAQVLTKLK